MLVTLRRGRTRVVTPGTLGAKNSDRERGHVSDVDVRTVKDAGYSNADAMEIVVHFALNTLTNYVNEIAKTEIDFRPVDWRRAA